MTRRVGIAEVAARFTVALAVALATFFAVGFAIPAGKGRVPSRAICPPWTKHGMGAAWYSLERTAAGVTVRSAWWLGRCLR